MSANCAADARAMSVSHPGRMSANCRGWMQIIEVVIAAMLIFYYIGYMASAFRYTQSPVDDNVRFRKLAEDTLITLDNTQRGSTTILRDDLNKRNHTDLIRATEYFIRYPYTYSYEIAYQNETYLSRSLPKKPSASANYLVLDLNEGKPAKYAIKLTVWATG